MNPELRLHTRDKSKEVPDGSDYSIHIEVRVIANHESILRSIPVSVQTDLPMASASSLALALVSLPEFSVAI